MPRLFRRSLSRSLLALVALTAVSAPGCGPGADLLPPSPSPTPVPTPAVYSIALFNNGEVGSCNGVAAFANTHVITAVRFRPCGATGGDFYGVLVASGPIPVGGNVEVTGLSPGCWELTVEYAGNPLDNETALCVTQGACGPWCFVVGPGLPRPDVHVGY